MTSDSSEREPAAPRVGYGLPDVIGVNSRRIEIDRRGPRNFESALPSRGEAIEFVVETEGPIPTRALGPVLYVGEVPLVEVTADDETHYRFVGLQPEALDAGAPLSLGWSGRPDERQMTEYRYEG